MDGLFRVECGSFSRHTDVNTQTATRWNVPPKRVYADWQELLKAEQGQVDAVVILTPTPSHPEQVHTALEHGHAVICEKALATSSEIAQEIHETAQKNKAFLAVTYNYTGYPMLRELKQTIKAGRLGRIQQVQIEMPQEGFASLDRNGNPKIPQQWRLKDGEVPTISLDLGVHLHHIIDFLTGTKPVRVVAHQASFGKYREVIDNVNAIAEYTEDVICSLWYSKAALGCRNGLKVRVYGEQGAAEWLQMDPEHLQLHDNRGHTYRIDRGNVDAQEAQLARYNRFKVGHPAGFLEAFANVYADIATALTKTTIEGEHAIYSTKHAIEGLYLLESIAQSANQHCWTDVPPIP
jgi:predicted dehydrogenase